MNTVVIDIETAPLEVSPGIKSGLTKNCKDQIEIEIELEKAALYPLTGRVVCAGMLNPASGNESVLCDNDEALILSTFWAAVRAFDQIVTFNGRGFDIPFLIMRSAILDVTPSRHDLMGQRFASYPHCDLLDQFTFYGVTRKFTLEMYCLAFGIDSPKCGMSGADVGRAFAEGRLTDIKEYNARDLRATAELYERFTKYFRKYA